MDRSGNRSTDMSNNIPTADDELLERNGETRPIEENLKSRRTWTRLLFMVICAILISIASFVGWFVIVFGFLWVLFTGQVNREIQQVGQSIASYIYENVRYLTFNTDDRPFPLGNDWPSGSAE
jgi:hypothetical protein